MKRIFIAMLFFIFAHTAYASQSTIACPSIETMHQASDAIVDAGYVNGSYMATTDPFAIHASNMGWFAVVYNIDATSTVEALSKAREAMRAIARQETEFAENHMGIYVCMYDHGKIEVINNEEDWRFTKRIH